MNVTKDINGHTVVAKPIFKGSYQPAYWMAIVNERTVGRTFASPRDAFSFVEATLNEDTAN
jgi:hypothetical protein